MEVYYIYVSDSQTEGPFGLDEIKIKVDSGSLTREHYLWYEEGAGWVRADGLLPQLFGQEAVEAGKTGGHSGISFESITSNPYRVLGVAIDASEREKKKIVEMAKKFAKAKKEIPAEKLPVKGFNLSVPPRRSLEELQEAVSRIQQVEGKVKHAHMWFWESNAVDKKAFQSFRDNKPQEGTELLERNVAGKGVSANNYSSVRNLGLYYLDKSTAHGALDTRFLIAGIQNLGKFCGSEYFEEYSQKAGDERLQVQSHTVQQQLIDNIYTPLRTAIDSNTLNIKELIAAFETFPEHLRKYLSDKFTASHINDVESFIEKADQTGKSDPAKGYSAAIELYNQSQPRLAFLGKILSADDFQLERLKTEIASTMRACALAYHNELVEGDEDPGEEGLEVTKLALKVCSTGTTGESLREDIEFLKDWNKNRASREKQKPVQGDIDILVKHLEASKNASGRAALAAARDLINQGQSALARIKSALGAQDEQYKDMSNVVAVVATGLLIDYANTTTDCASVVPLMEKIGQMDMSSETKGHWSENMRVLQGNISAGSGGGCLASLGSFVLSLWPIGLCILFSVLSDACD